MDTPNNSDRKSFTDPGSLSTGQLEQMVAEHPYCAVAQFYLLHNYSRDEFPKFEKQAQKTALFFNNSHLLDWQLRVLNLPQPSEAVISIPAQEILQESTVHQHTDPVISELSKEGPGIPETQHIPATPILPVVPSTDKENEPLIPFEPLHTVDYFASQGIKITEEGLTGDKLGKQLKSFTEWLKSMKKVHSEMPEEGNHVSDKKIQTIAEASNSGEEVLTEAMAEVLLMQGKNDKAIDTYRKLSFINPAKSAYFAAKIDSIKAL